MRSYRATCNKQIPSTGIHYFEITHDRIGKGNYLWTGFFVNWALEGFDLRANTKMYLTFDKRDNAIYCNGNYLHLNDSKTSDINEDGGINEGELITSLVDMDNNFVAFFVNKKYIGKCEFELNEEEKQLLTPYVNLYDNGSKEISQISLI